VFSDRSRGPQRGRTIQRRASLGSLQPRIAVAVTNARGDNRYNRRVMYGQASSVGWQLLIEVGFDEDELVNLLSIDSSH
jgi:hypothetical protein